MSAESPFQAAEEKAARPDVPVTVTLPFGLGTFALPKIELPKIELPKVELPKVELPKVELRTPNLKDVDVKAVAQDARVRAVEVAKDVRSNVGQAVAKVRQTAGI